MNYRHIFHAANFADVLKHVAVTHVLGLMAKKNKPICVIDTHAGAGAYDLGSAHARRSGEAEQGLRKLADRPDLPAPVARYVALVGQFARKFGEGPEAAGHYPGSPRLLRALMRPGDRMVACELHAEQARLLKREFSGDKQVDVRQEDGYALLKSALPPHERRALVLIDPPFEARDEFAQLTRNLAQARRRFATGVFLVWYPLKDRAAGQEFCAAVAAMGWPEALSVTLEIGPVAAEGPLKACGLVLINPPWQTDTMLKKVLPFLADGMAGRAGKWSLNWLSGEHAPPASVPDRAPAAGKGRR